jgi:Flp pilus assembly protein TadG
MSPSDRHAAIERQRGYVLPMTALLLIPMMLFAGFATDVGSWYLQGQRAQVAADAGAAAGVVWVPDPTAYSNNALEAVRRNGFPNASLVTSFAAAEASPTPPTLPWVEVTLTTNSTLQVAVRTEADTFFTSPILDSVTVTRRAEAQYIEPTPLGNPTSALGTGGDTEYPGMPDNFYLQTRNDTRRNGDIIGPAAGVFGTPNPLFTSLAARPELQGAYFYEIDVPATAAGLYRLELRVSCHSSSNSTDLEWAVYAPDGTDTDFTDNVAAGPISWGERRRVDNTCTDADPTDGFNTRNRGRVETATQTHVQFIDTASGSRCRI